MFKCLALAHRCCHGISKGSRPNARAELFHICEGSIPPMRNSDRVLAAQRSNRPAISHVADAGENVLPDRRWRRSRSRNSESCRQDSTLTLEKPPVEGSRWPPRFIVTCRVGKAGKEESLEIAYRGSIGRAMGKHPESNGTHRKKYS